MEVSLEKKNQDSISVKGKRTNKQILPKRTFSGKPLTSAVVF